MKRKMKFLILYSAWVYLVLGVAGAILNLAVNLLKGIPLFPLKRGLFIFIIFMGLATVWIAATLLRNIFLRSANEDDVVI